MASTAERVVDLFQGARLTPTQRRIAHSLVQHAPSAAYLSAAEVAELAGVSQPSVTRFAMALGYAGYPALRRELRALVGVGTPFWWLTGQAVAALLWIARTVASAPGSVVALPSMPLGAFAIMVGGGLWLALWRTRWRTLGLVPLAIGAGWALITPPPDLLVTGDGRHVAVRTRNGLSLLRERAGDYTRSTLAENGGTDGEPLLLDGQREARCSRDLCIVDVLRDGRRWRMIATRSGYLVPVRELVAACGQADIVVSERGRPRRCRPRWLRLDRHTLARTGGVAVTFAGGRVVTVRQPGDRHPWMVAATIVPDRVGAEIGGR